MAKPALSTIPEWYHKYVDQVQEEDVNKALQVNLETAVQFFRSLQNEKWIFRYAEGKWTIKEMLQHIIDTERIFAYRALCFARGEKTSLPGFEENDYAAASKANNRPAEEMITEFETVRKSIQQMYASFDEEQLKAVGVANNNPVSVNGIGFIIPGHVQHHINILKERYL